MTALALQSISRSFVSGSTRVNALVDVDVEVSHGESMAILGPSGSGKSTLLGLVAGLEQPDSGTVVIDGQNLAELDEDGLAELRATKIGVVFQQFRLLPDLTAWENVLVPLELSGVDTAAERRERAIHCLHLVGLAERVQHRPAQLSGGEQQRVALARALAIRPALIVADEPTGSLDQATGTMIADMLFDLVQQEGIALLLVTHDEGLAERCDRITRIQAGKVVS